MKGKHCNFHRGPRRNCKLTNSKADKSEEECLHLAGTRISQGNLCALLVLNVKHMRQFPDRFSVRGMKFRASFAIVVGKDTIRGFSDHIRKLGCISSSRSHLAIAQHACYLYHIAPVIEVHVHEETDHDNSICLWNPYFFRFPRENIAIVPHCHFQIYVL